VKVMQPDGSVVPWMETKAGAKAAEAEAAAAQQEGGDSAAAAAPGGDSAAAAAADATVMPAAEAVEAVKAKLKAKPNESCPCGSGSKFKKCCGGNAA
jgi:uncharacterized protein YecA (UPF0149 family)